MRNYFNGTSSHPRWKREAEKPPTPGAVLEKVVNDLLVLSPSGQGS